MASHGHASHRHHHHPDRAHPPATVHLSILRLSLGQRLLIAGTVIVVLWLAAFWAMR